MVKLDRMILSSNDDETFYDFWPIVSNAWKKIFNNNFIIELAFITNRNENDPLVKDMKKHGEVTIFKPIEGIPSSNQSKVTRTYLATLRNPNDFCMVNDIDVLPLQSKFLNYILEKSDYNKLSCVGHDAYIGTPDEGKFVMHYFGGRSSLIKDFLNPNDLPYEELLKSWIGLNICDEKEDISLNMPKDPEFDIKRFSDESLFRALLKIWNKEENINKIHRGLKWSSSEQYEKRNGISRCSWQIDSEKLENGNYIQAHLPRPYKNNIEKIKPLIEYINNNF